MTINEANRISEVETLAGLYVAADYEYRIASPYSQDAMDRVWMACRRFRDAFERELRSGLFHADMPYCPAIVREAAQIGCTQYNAQMGWV